MKVQRSLIGVLALAYGVIGTGAGLSQEREHNYSHNSTAVVDKIPEASVSKEVGLAAFYHSIFQGRRTASGESFDHDGLTAAHKTLPFGTFVRVINLRNHKSVIVRVNDRGPMQADRVIDVTRRVAGLLGFLRLGTTPVALEILPLGAAIQ